MGRAAKWLLAAAAGAVLLAVASGAATWYAWRALNAPLALEERTWLEVPSGSPLRRVSERLAERGLLARPWLLTAYGRVTGQATRIHAGEYELVPGTTPVSLLDQLVAGQVYLHQITVVEGARFADFLAALRSHPAVTATTLTPEEIMAELGQPGVHPEGQFFPDTYRFPRGTRDIDVLRTAHDAMQRRLQEAWEARADNLAVQTPYEALILASIIEKETGLAAERPLIAGVFHERLRRGMLLQTDPTVIYGLGDRFDGNLRRRDLEADTPYNTYVRRGLPPTPIALPGAESLAAAVAPAATDALFFVASGRGDGSHVFSATLEEHNRAVRALIERTAELQQ
ncbi:MAG TPA: endolytic transglycosylase MltG [Gammaproteobacteria bacterium]